MKAADLPKMAPKEGDPRSRETQTPTRMCLKFQCFVFVAGLSLPKNDGELCSSLVRHPSDGTIVFLRRSGAKEVLPQFGLSLLKRVKFEF